MRYILIIMALIGGWAAYTNRAGISDAFAAEPDRYPADHIIHITAKLEFDGKPVVIDDLIDCLAEGRGTPTQSAHLTFRLSRNEIVAEIPGGGAIVIPTSRQMCYAYGDTWGDTFDEFTVPDGWTPVIQWYDHRDPKVAQEGIQYLSETAITDQNGRLSVTEDFQITIPQHPASQELIAEAQRQTITRNWWLGDTDGASPGVMGSMIEIPEKTWRNPDPIYLRTSVHQTHDADPQPLINYLEGLGEGTGLAPIPFPKNETSENPSIPKDALLFFGALSAGSKASKGNLFDFGIPKPESDRFGMLISEKSAQRYRDSPLSLDRYDMRYPWKCVNGVAIPDFENPGLVYYYRERCTHPNYYQGASWPGKTFTADWNPSFGAAVFDLETKSLWLLKL